MLLLRLRRTVIVGLLVWLGSGTGVFAQAKDPDPARFAAEIQAFQTWDTKNAVPVDAVLFVGSSTIRLWNTADRFPGLPIVNRGFGGSHISDVNHFIDAVATKYAADVVVFYAGDNDINDGKTPERVLADYQAFVTRVHAAKASTRIIFLGIKPSLARWKLWPVMQRANEMVRAFSATRPNLLFLDCSPEMLGPNGQPRPSLFVDDGLHMTAEGYTLWTRLLQPVLAKARTR